MEKKFFQIDSKTKICYYEMTEHLGFGGDKKVYLFLYQKIIQESWDTVIRIFRILFKKAVKEIIH